MCLGNIFKNFAANNMKKARGLNGYIYDFFDDYNFIDTNNIINIHNIWWKNFIQNVWLYLKNTYWIIKRLHNSFGKSLLPNLERLTKNVYP